MAALSGVPSHAEHLPIGGNGDRHGVFNLTAKDKPMPQIGQFTRDKTGFSGRIETFTLLRNVVLVPAEPSEAENAPDYRVHTANDDNFEPGPESGAAWKRHGERAGEYIALVINDPALPQPIRANLFRDDEAGNAWSLHWSRQPKRDGKD